MPPLPTEIGLTVNYILFHDIARKTGDNIYEVANHISCITVCRQNDLMGNHLGFYLGSIGQVDSAKLG